MSVYRKLTHRPPEETVVGIKIRIAQTACKERRLELTEQVKTTRMPTSKSPLSKNRPTGRRRVGRSGHTHSRALDGQPDDL